MCYTATQSIMGNFYSKNNELDQLKNHFKLEIKGKTECVFEGAGKSFSDETHKQFQAWLFNKKYTIIFEEDYVKGTFKYHIKNKI